MHSQQHIVRNSIHGSYLEQQRFTGSYCHVPVWLEQWRNRCCFHLRRCYCLQATKKTHHAICFVMTNFWSIALFGTGDINHSRPKAARLGWWEIWYHATGQSKNWFARCKRKIHVHRMQNWTGTLFSRTHSVFNSQFVENATWKMANWDCPFRHFWTKTVKNLLIYSKTDDQINGVVYMEPIH